MATVAAISGDNAPAISVGDVIMSIDSRYFRPAEVETLLGDPTKAEEVMGWKPKITAQQMCAEMVREDLKLSKQSLLLRDNGYNVTNLKEVR